MIENHTMIDDNEIEIDVTAKTFAQSAEKIGAGLIAGAIWDRSRDECTWIGRAELPDAPATVASAALVANLYTGSAGVGLFLAELHARTGDREALSTAAGAIRRALDYTRKVDRPSTSPLSFWAGHLGVAYAALRVQELAPEIAFDDEIAWALDCAEDALLKKHPLDLMGGNAGAVAPLLTMSRHAGYERCRDLALRCGEEILSTATWGNGLCSWDARRASGGDVNTPPWTGFSHGASGMATALLDLFDLTGDERFRATARAAFAYEDLCYSPQHGNWLDVRFPHMVQGETITGSFQTAWCHGAPGIAMARLRAIASDPEGRDRYESTGRIAIGTTIGAVERALSGPPTDATLCHGVAGLLEVLLTCALLLEDDVLRRNAAEYASRLLERHAGSGEWPSGITSTGPTPSLMIGTAGVGYHFLRQAAPHDVPGLLLFGR